MLIVVKNKETSELYIINKLKTYIMFYVFDLFCCCFLFTKKNQKKQNNNQEEKSIKKSKTQSFVCLFFWQKKFLILGDFAKECTFGKNYYYSVSFEHRSYYTSHNHQPTLKHHHQQDLYMFGSFQFHSIFRIFFFFVSIIVSRIVSVFCWLIQININDCLAD